MAGEDDPLVSGFRASNVRAMPLVAEPFDWPDPASLPPRRWLLGVRALLGYCTAVVSPGGIGKTALGVAWALSVASGRELLGREYRPWLKGAVWVFNLEDPRAEMVKRFAAAAKYYDLTAADCAPIYINSGRDRKLCIAKLLHQAGDTIIYPDKDALIEEARARDVRLIIVDPFVSSHELIENDNVHMAAAMQAWGEVASATEAAIVLVHHTRKGAQGGEIDDARGGSAIANAARVGLTLARMDKAEAERFSIPVRERWRYVRLDDAKSNLAPPAESATWIRLLGVDLQNGDETYPSGDSVQVVSVWQPADLFAGITHAQVNAALDAIEAGLDGGVRYAPTRHSKARWAGQVLTTAWGITDQRAADMISAWLHSGLLVEVEYHDPGSRKARQGVRVNNHKRPS